jgi:hypothetical protein
MPPRVLGSRKAGAASFSLCLLFRVTTKKPKAINSSGFAVVYLVVGGLVLAIDQF